MFLLDLATRPALYGMFTTFACRTKSNDVAVTLLAPIAMLIRVSRISGARRSLEAYAGWMRLSWSWLDVLPTGAALTLRAVAATEDGLGRGGRRLDSLLFRLQSAVRGSSSRL